MKEIETANKWSDNPYFWIVIINIIIIFILTKEINRFNAILSKFQCHFFLGIEKNPKIHMGPQNLPKYFRIFTQNT
jgi:hypothetical protein